VFVADIYPAREQPIPGVTAAMIVDSTRAAGGTDRGRAHAARSPRARAKPCEAETSC
jgi:hypothetical protein